MVDVGSINYENFWLDCVSFIISLNQWKEDFKTYCGVSYSTKSGPAGSGLDIRKLNSFVCRKTQKCLLWILDGDASWIDRDF